MLTVKKFLSKRGGLYMCFFLSSSFRAPISKSLDQNLYLCPFNSLPALLVWYQESNSESCACQAGTVPELYQQPFVSHSEIGSELPRLGSNPGSFCLSTPQCGDNWCVTPRLAFWFRMCTYMWCWRSSPKCLLSPLSFLLGMGTEPLQPQYHCAIPLAPNSLILCLLDLP